MYILTMFVSGKHLWLLRVVVFFAEQNLPVGHMQRAFAKLREFCRTFNVSRGKHVQCVEILSTQNEVTV